MSRVATSILAVVLAATAPAQSGTAVWFSGARHPDGFADPRAAFAELRTRVERGDVLEYARLAPAGVAASAGVEILFDDGSLLAAPPVHASGDWTHVRVPLDRWVGRRIERFELSAHGFAPGPIAFAVDDVAIVHTEARRDVVFTDHLGAGVAEGAFAKVVTARADGGSERAIVDVAVGDPWAALALELTPGPVDIVGGVPRRRGAAEPLRARRVGFAPIEGGRAYELALFVENTSDEELELTLRVFGLQNERRAVAFCVPPRGAPPPLGAGFLDGDVACIVLPIASEFAIVGVELPDEPRASLHAASAHWRRTGIADAEFRAAWIEREGRARFSERARLALEGWSRARRAAKILRLARHDARDRALYDALFAGDLVGASNALAAAREAWRSSGETLRGCRVTFTWSALEPAAVAHALERLGTDPAACAFGGTPSELEALARSDCAAHERLRELEAAGRWTTFGAPYARGGDRSSSLEAWLADARLSHASNRRSAASVSRAWLDESESECSELAPLFARAGVTSAFAYARDALPREPFVVWNAPNAAPLACLFCVPPWASAAGADALPWGAWSDLVFAERGAREIFVALDAASPRADLDRAFVSFLESCEMALEVRWSTPDGLLDEMRGAERSGVLALARATAAPALDRAELRAARAVQHARAALAVESSAAALAALDGLTDDESQRAAAWRVLSARCDEDRASALEAESRVRMRRSLDVAALACDTRGAGVPLLAFNPLPWQRKALVELPDGRLSIASTSGQAILTQASARGGLLFELDVPGLGIAAARVLDRAPDGTREPAATHIPGVETFDLGFENAHARVAFVAESAAFASVRFTGGDELLSAPTFVVWSDGPALERLSLVEPLDIVERGPLRALSRCALSSKNARVELEIALDAGARRIDVRARATAESGRVRLVLPVRGSRATAISAARGTRSVADDARALHAPSSWFARGSLAVLSGTLAAFSSPPGALVIELDVGRTVDFALAPREAELDVAAVEREREIQLFAAESHDGARALPRATLEFEGGVLLPSAIATVRGGHTWRVVLSERAGQPASLRVDSALLLFGVRRIDLFGDSLADIEVEDRHRFDLEIGPHDLMGLEIDLAP